MRALSGLEGVVSRQVCMNPARYHIITGGLGLIGQRILRSLIRSSPPSDCAILVVDTAVHSPRAFAAGALTDYCSSSGSRETLLACSNNKGDEPGSVSFVQGDIGSPAVVAALDGFAAERALVDAPLTVFHLASVMSAQGESDFEQALRVNIDGEFDFEG